MQRLIFKINFKEDVGRVEKQIIINNFRNDGPFLWFENFQLLEYSFIEIEDTAGKIRLLNRVLNFFREYKDRLSIDYLIVSDYGRLKL